MRCRCGVRGSSGESRDVTPVESSWSVPLRKVPPRRAQSLSSARLDLDAVPLIRRPGARVKDELVLLAQLVREPQIHGRELALLLDDEVRRPRVAGDVGEPLRGE